LAEGYRGHAEPWALLQRGMQTAGQGTRMGVGPMRDLFRCAILLSCCAVTYKLVTACSRSRRMDVRRCRAIGRFLRWSGWDEFDPFAVIVTIHSLQDIRKTGLVGSREFKVVVEFYWSKFTTTPTRDLRWDQTKGMEVPQGASYCWVSLYSIGSFKDSKVATVHLETKKDMLDKDAFWGKKQKLKMEHKGKLVGTLLATFRKQGEGDQGGFDELPIEGISMESALAIEVMREWEELQRMPGYVKPLGKLEGDQALYLLSKVMTDDLREIDDAGRELGKVFIRVMHVNFADLQGEDREEELEKQVEKARKKGKPGGLARKWYWCWYEDKKHATKRWMHPDGYIPLASISNVYRAPERYDEFVIKYTHNHEKEFLRYRRESGKGLDVWVDGLDLAFQAARAAMKDQKRHVDRDQEAMQRMAIVHKQWVRSYGAPQSQSQWKAWFNHLHAQNFSEEMIARFYRHLTAHAR